MKVSHHLVLGSALLVIAAGCGDQKERPQPVSLRPGQPAAECLDGLDLAAKYQVRGTASARTPVAELADSLGKRRTEPLPLEGSWVPSGWMGDATTGGTLEFRVCEEDFHSPPTCEEWSYDPSKGRLGWASVAYQFPENNWGFQKGKDLSQEGFTQLTFFAKGKEGGERILVKSGGHTSSNAAFPASYECSNGVITLTARWQKYSMPLRNADMVNTTAAFVFVVSRQLCPQGCVFYLDDIAFRGPDD
jgi:hypothetical protein